ncbi:hypothetical protein H2200_010931 [Cladophialophora chaetospira]|uniref:Putative gamma-glutamylcyclotransferase n=1 Tax=Cladophialophora chaetospira TaxID=386627 RepID=A0AA38X103_9EURO|nr:hypothetical protein H2200_010931 [Cladophialophora chaetospira]
MDLLDELETLANAASLSEDTATEPDASRWQTLFGSSEAEAIQRLEEYRADFARQQTLATARESIESHQQLTTDHNLQENEHQFSPAINNNTYIVQLAGPLVSPSTIQTAANLPSPPQIHTGQSEHGTSTFCEIDGPDRAALLCWTSKHHPSYRPTIVRLTRAKKDLSPISIAPTLGVDATLPQYRLQDERDTPRPAQAEYPVWYFFCGTLGDPGVLKHHLDVEDEPELIPAHVTGGGLWTWGAKYRAIVDAEPDARVDGWAFLVQSEEQEDALRFYEKEKYEVVRCRIFMDRDGGEDEVNGLISRFNGAKGELD